jgi:large subunit ribosomal protein L6
LSNTFLGIGKEYSISILIKGVGFKSKLLVSQEANFKPVLKLSLGHSHILKFAMPRGCTVELLGKKELSFKGICYQEITQLVSFIQNFKAPDVYKGKGLNYQYKIKVLKPGKKQ